jgi:integrase
MKSSNPDEGECPQKNKRLRTNRTGVYVRESSLRRHLGKPDKCYDICYRLSSGRLKWEKIGWISEGYTSAMASNIRGERIRAARHGDVLPDGKKKQMTFGQAWGRFYEWAELNRRSHHDDALRYNKHLKDHLGHLMLSEISPFHVERIKGALGKQKLAPQTIKHILGLVREVFNKAILWGDFSGENPTKGVKFPSTAHTNRLRYLTRAEAGLLLQRVQVYSAQLYEICLLALHTGMRAGEIWNLRWADIDLKAGTIHILGPDYAHGPKGERSRLAHMTGELIELFKQKKAALPVEKETKAWLPYQRIFRDRFGRKIKSFSGSFDLAVDDLKLNEGIKDRRHKVVPHTLRHTFGSWLAMAGVSLQTIKEMMGHSRIEQTERYAHLCPDKKRQAVEILESMLAVPESSAIGEMATQEMSRGDAEGAKNE